MSSNLDSLDKVRVAKLLAGVLHEILRHKVSLDVAFKRVCSGSCARGLEEREALYELSRRFIKDFVKLTCVSRKHRPRDLARLWLSGFDEPSEPYCRYSIPSWFYDRMYKLIGEDVEKLFKAMESRIWWLRVNTFKASIESVIRDLESEDVIVEESRDYPYMLRIIKTAKPVRLLKVVREFKAIPQDIASAAAVESMRLERGDKILDACAAPGIKTSLMAMLTDGNIRIKAIDISGRRMAIMRNLMKKLGVPEDIIDYTVADARTIKLNEYYDKAFVDAPCSNSGAIAKDPSLRVTLKPDKVRYYSRIQKEILANISKYTNRITYTTCSLLPEEGEDVVETLLDKASLEKPRIPGCVEGHKGYRISEFLCRLYPHIHLSEGFFIANLVLG